MVAVRSTLGWCGQVVAWLVILAVAVGLGAAVLVPRLAGATPYTVLTGSMRPDLPPGTLVVVRSAPAESIHVGDVITYQLESGKPTVVTHRVIAVGATVTGEPVFTTRGDANDVADEAPVRPVQVKGRLWYSVPYLGRVNTILSGSQRQATVSVVGGALLLYAAFMFTGAMRDRRRAAAPTTSVPDEEESLT